MSPPIPDPSIRFFSVSDRKEPKEDQESEVTFAKFATRSSLAVQCCFEIQKTKRKRRYVRDKARTQKQASARIVGYTSAAARGCPVSISSQTLIGWRGKTKTRNDKRNWELRGRKIRRRRAAPKRPVFVESLEEKIKFS